MSQQRYGNKTLKGLALASVPYGREDHLPMFFFRYLKGIKMDTWENGDISKDFTKYNVLTPVIFSHGMSGNRNWNSGTCRDLASHGFIVFSIDHRDRTSNYVETIDGVGMYYDNLKQSHD